MVRMNKIIGSSKELGEKDEPILTDPASSPPSSGASDAGTLSKPLDVKGLILPGPVEKTEPLVQTGLELPQTTTRNAAVTDFGADGDLLFYRAVCQYVNQFMIDVAALNVNTLVNYGHQIVDRIRAGDSLLRFEMSPAYIEAFLGAHPVNVAILAAKLAEVLRLDETRALRVVVAALVHDVGMTRLPLEVIRNNRGLAPDEEYHLRQHPNYGAEIILERFGAEYEWLAVIVRQEHERIQGAAKGGYPQGLTGDQIDPNAQLIGILDVYEALTHPRRQRPAESPSKAIKQLLESGNQYFITPMRKALLDALSYFPLGTTVQLNTGEVGEVVSTNRKYPMRPLVEVRTDANHRPLSQPKRVDLKDNPILSISKSIDPE